MIDKLGSPETYNHYPTGWAVAFSTPYRMFKRYTLPGRRLRPAGDPLAEGHERARRGPRAVPPLDRHLPDDPRRLRGRDARGGQRRRAVAARRASRCATRSTPPTRRREKKTQYYEMFGQPRPLARGLEGGHRARPDELAMSNFEDDNWQLFHTDEDRAEAHDLAEEHPEKVKELDGLWFEEAKANNVLPLNDLRSRPRTSRPSSRWSSRSRCRRAASTRTTRGRPQVPERNGRQRPRRVLQGRWRRSSSPPTREGVIFAAGLALRRPLPVRQGRQAARTPTTSSASRPRCGSSRDAPTSGRARRRRRVHQGAHGRAPRVTRSAEALRRRRGGRRGGDPHHDRPLQPLRRGAVHRLRQRRRRLAASTRRSSSSPAARSRRSSSTSPTTSTSTSSATWPRRWRATRSAGGLDRCLDRGEDRRCVLRPRAAEDVAHLPDVAGDSTSATPRRSRSSRELAAASRAARDVDEGHGLGVEHHRL